ncbi:lactate racemase domain-containing protein [Planctomicrobium sp. SH668]|uniref:lactate racemase domain-containing protein n=1 Tax=Planctomicrobium sp. SH668 TaxID=3448126 RepID=UPI003F5C05D0
MPLPQMYRIRQKFDPTKVADVSLETVKTLSRLNLESKVRPGQTVAITVGSRGIHRIPEIVKAIVDVVKQLGATPFIVPAMGSHGGATAEGQTRVLESLGVTPDAVGAEIRSSMETVIVATTEQGLPVHFDKHAFGADHVLVAGRIKPHTLFTGEIESGLHKMMLIGLGKHAGALLYHRAISSYSFATIIHSVAAQLIEKCRILAGVAIVENSFDETAHIEAILPENFYEREKELFKKAQGLLPMLPFPEADLLIVDKIGKNISGSGMDTNVIGRKYNDHVAMPGDRANCKRIMVRGLTSETNGNAAGIGIAEFTTQSVVDQIDFEYTRINCITSSHVPAGMIPLIYPNDNDAIEDALKTVGMVEPEDARVMQIADTMHLEQVLVSDAYLRDGVQHPHEVLEGPFPMQFDEKGFLRDVYPSFHN